MQFFKGPNYSKGVDWYMDFFPSSNSSITVFEKSATYFDGEDVPARAHRLLPDAQVVVVLLPPAERAYSWYQHQRAHKDPAALNHTFLEVVGAGAGAGRALLGLQGRCLEPGRYALHLERWLAHYKPAQLHLVDGVELRQDPATALNALQRTLGVSPFVDFNTKLVFDKKKGFYCYLGGGRRGCRGKGKGRRYPPMAAEARALLGTFYRKADQQLEKLLLRLGVTPPPWLQGG